jgi:formate hydrogenlyase subunit 3/multisubunit Na+/H+ antiporter MnhD subunit
MSEAKGMSTVRTTAPGWLTTLQGFLTQLALFFGIVLIVLGIVSLAYFASPLRLMVEAFEQQNNDPTIPILGALALIGGIALLFATKTRSLRRF